MAQGYQPEPLNKLLRSTSCAPAVLGILMYSTVHSGSCAPPTRNLSSLATLIQRFRLAGIANLG